MLDYLNVLENITKSYDIKFSYKLSITNDKIEFEYELNDQYSFSSDYSGYEKYLLLNESIYELKLLINKVVMKYIE